MESITKITTCENVALVTLRNTSNDMEFIAGVFKKIAQKGINVDMISQTAPLGGKIDLSFTTSEDNLGGILELLAQIREKHPQLKSDISGGNCKISLYGDMMREIPGVAANAFDLLASCCADIRLITTSEVDISILIPESDFNNVLDIFHNAYKI